MDANLELFISMLDTVSDLMNNMQIVINMREQCISKISIQIGCEITIYPPRSHVNLILYVDRLT